MNFNKYIDHTILKSNASHEDIIKLCNEAKEYGFYSVCVNPCFVKLCKNMLEGSGVKVACVIGFPLGANLTEVKKYEAQMAVNDGADELDMVINIAKLKEKDYEFVLNDINAVCEVGAVVKVIIETSVLTEDEIVKMCEIVNKSNALFIKTSTGFVGDGARLEHIKLMKKHMLSTKKIKASGGIRDKETFIKMIEAGAERIGTSSGIKIVGE